MNASTISLLLRLHNKEEIFYLPKGQANRVTYIDNLIKYGHAELEDATKGRRKVRITPAGTTLAAYIIAYSNMYMIGQLELTTKEND